MNKQEKFRSFGIVFNKPIEEGKDTITDSDFKELVSSTLQQLSAKYCEFNYYYILHNQDIIEETGELKTSHIHCVVEYKNAVSFSKLLGYLVAFYPRSNCVQVDGLHDTQLSVQYLIHKNDKDKYQYSNEDIITNNEKKLVYYLTKKDIEEYELYDIIQECNSLGQIACRIGMKSFRKYGYVINLLFNEKEAEKEELLLREKAEAFQRDQTLAKLQNENDNMQRLTSKLEKLGIKVED